MSELSNILDSQLPLQPAVNRKRPSDPWFDVECRQAKRELVVWNGVMLLTAIAISVPLIHCMTPTLLLQRWLPSKQLGTHNGNIIEASGKQSVMRFGVNMLNRVGQVHRCCGELLIAFLVVISHRQPTP